MNTVEEKKLDKKSDVQDDMEAIPKESREEGDVQGEKSILMESHEEGDVQSEHMETIPKETREEGDVRGGIHLVQESNKNQRQKESFVNFCW